MNSRRNRRRGVAATHIVETGKEALMINNMGVQRDDPGEDDNGVATCRPTPNYKRLAAPANEELTGLSPVTSGPTTGSTESPVLPCYSVGLGVSFPFGQLLPRCSERGCNCNALIAWSNRSDPKETGVVCLGHGLQWANHWDVQNLALIWTAQRRYRFISPEHEAALRAFLA